MTSGTLRRTCQVALIVLSGLSSGIPVALADGEARISFSANFSVVDPSLQIEPGTGKFYHGTSGMRFEFLSGTDFSVFPVDVIIVDAVHLRMVTLNSKNMSYMVDVFPKDLFERYFSMQGGPCGSDRDDIIQARPFGVEVLHGRPVEKWHCVYADHGARSNNATLWYDPALAFPIRVEDDTGTMYELSNIVEAEQPSALFQVPRGYVERKLPETTGEILRFTLPPSSADD